MQPLTAPFGTDSSASWETDTFTHNKPKVNGPKTPAFTTHLLPSISFYIFTIESPFGHLISLHQHSMVLILIDFFFGGGGVAS